MARVGPRPGECCWGSVARAVSWLGLYWWAPLSILGAVAVGVWALPEGEIEPPPVRVVSGSPGRADPANFLPGALNSEAVQTARDFEEFPLLWLGESFRGFHLVDVVRANYFIPKEAIGAARDRAENSVRLIYGTCVRVLSNQRSCPPPVTIIVFAPGTARRPDQMAPGPSSSARGGELREVNLTQMLWFGDGISVQIHANREHQADALFALRGANAARFGLPELAAGSNLGALAQVTAGAGG